jgi:hypothetical protein
MSKKKSDDKWYIKYKWWIIGVIAMLMVLVLAAYVMSSKGNNNRGMPNLNGGLRNRST